ncbi:condensin complex component cnd2 [Metarhizium album ARSEF 1941]|uniref:Condensin complex subunit 2 n=1 Tax=Metarhizium album (strain ARSEF 1941) TaxID=1081103 RepID=A0A0B2WTS3_METAS|nr:condensin complex component cnd2 [Metarhizium album ARSEF 1941]KHN96315.1 condensin complex component cnd2 [Metarhizium album ARSEF 1941]
MPRVAQVPRARGVKSTSSSLSASPFKSPVKIPLNDDAHERGQRMHSRKALHEKQINEIKAAATPRKSSSRLDDIENASPGSALGTPRGGRIGEITEEVMVGGVSVTPIKRVPILANFEEWMKMATDNKINATNSWNFALIDYFHDMSLLKEGDGVNFQKASCTLDGCVKIYTNRVDSVATETGKLLSGLADSSSKKKGRDGEDADGDESEDELDEDGNPKKKSKKKTQRSSEATLAPSFSALQLKKFELEFTVDPLFKKASADFDEGGAKGLLLNHLMIDAQGRIVFDSSDDFGDVAPMEKDEHGEVEGADPDADEADITVQLEERPVEGTPEEAEAPAVEIDLASLGQRFLPSLSQLDGLDVCPSLKNFDIGDSSGSMDIPFLKAPEDWRDADKNQAAGDHSGMLIDDDAPIGFDDDDLGLGSFDIGGDVAFGEGGEAWARDAALAPQMRIYDAGMGDDSADGDGFDDNGEYMVTMVKPENADQMHEDILGFFDQALQKNWSSAEHWRIRKIKDASKPVGEAKKRKEKEPFEIDFAAPLESTTADMIHTPASSNAVISMPKKDWKSKSRNLLPDDKHFNSKSLLSLFLKPKARLSTRRIVGGFGPRTGHSQEQKDDSQQIEMDEAFWAKQKGPEDTVLPEGDYDANFFQDDGLPFPGGDDADDDDLEFADAREHLSPDGDPGMTEAGGITAMLGGETFTNAAFGHTLVTSTRRIRPEYVNYARKATKVDVRRLMKEIWKGMAFDQMEVSAHIDPGGWMSGGWKVACFLVLTSLQAPSGKRASMTAASEPEETPPPWADDATLNFTEVMNGLKSVYPKTAMNDISTSYCFISLLHLANEKGLVIDKSESLEELKIRKDWTAKVTEGGE